MKMPLIMRKTRKRQEKMESRKEKQARRSRSLMKGMKLMKDCVVAKSVFQNIKKQNSNAGQFRSQIVLKNLSN